jgi:hypothetical protein
MYDITSTEIHGDTTYYWCWWDYEETKLNKQLKGLVAGALGKDPRNKEHQNRLINFFKSLFFVETVHEINNGFEKICKKYFTPINCYQSLYLSPPTPPPKIFLNIDTYA